MCFYERASPRLRRDGAYLDRDAVGQPIVVGRALAGLLHEPGRLLGRGVVSHLEGDPDGAVPVPDLVRTGDPRKRTHPAMLRDLGRCQVPGCSHPAAHVHHIEFRSTGGSDDGWNLVCLCAPHHLRAIHGGLVRVSGRAPDGLTWEFPGSEWEDPRDAEPPLGDPARSAA